MNWLLPHAAAILATGGVGTILYLVIDLFGYRRSSRRHEMPQSRGRPRALESEPMEVSMGGTGRVRPPPPPKPTRFLAADFPARVPVGDVASLIVRIAVTGERVSRATAAGVLKALDVPGDGVRVTIVVQAPPGLVPLDRLDREVVVPPYGDSEPVRFPFEARALGLHRAHLTAWAGGTFLGELSVEVSAETGVPVTPRATYTASMGEARPTPGEATLQVRRGPGGMYTFQLLTHRNIYEAVEESFAGDPDDTVERTIATLRDLGAGRSGYTGATAGVWLREAGVNLWNQMVPRVIKEQFWEQRSTITAFNIATDHDIVPWELLYPLSPAEDEGFLVEQFPLLRRVYGQDRVAEVSLRDPAFVLPRDPPQEAYAEVSELNRRLRAALSIENGELIDRIGPLLERINSRSSGLLHFACHNRFDVSAGGSSVSMADGAFTPMMLTSAATGRVLESHPLVFVNACRSAGASYEYTRLMGWASGFMAAGAGAFVGTLWAVPSGPAREFATAFYDACLTDGLSLGEAIRAARNAISRPGDPTWLAYTAYGDPAARVVR